MKTFERACPQLIAASCAQFLILWGAAEAACDGDNDCLKCQTLTDWTGDACNYCDSSGLCSASIVTSVCGGSWYGSEQNCEDCHRKCPATSKARLNTCSYGDEGRGAYDGHCDEDQDGTCAVGTDTSDCSRATAEFTPAAFLYHATECIISGVGGVIDSVTQLVQVLVSIGENQVDQVCQQMVGKLTVRRRVYIARK
jgi:hypothetical protein